MSRGRRSNKLYVVAPDSLDREDFAPRDRLLPDVAEALDDRLSVSHEQTAAVDIATIQWLKRSPTTILRDRLEELGDTPTGESLAHHVKEREQLARRADALTRQIAATEQRLVGLSQSRPSLLRRGPRRSHRASQALHSRSHSGLRRMRDSVLREIEEREQSIRALREAPEDAGRDAERRRIKKELVRRHAIELAVERSSAREL